MDVEDAESGGLGSNDLTTLHVSITWSMYDDEKRIGCVPTACPQT